VLSGRNGKKKDLPSLTKTKNNVKNKNIGEISVFSKSG
jgi:hypothetical protein